MDLRKSILIIYLNDKATLQLYPQCLTQLLIGPGKDNNYFRGGYHHPPKRNGPFPFSKILVSIECSRDVSACIFYK